VCYQLAVEMENEQKWLQLSDVATKLGDFSLVQECLTRAQSFGSLLLLASAGSDQQLMTSIGEQSRKSGQFNIAFLSNFVLGKLDTCLDILIENERLPEAAFFARTYLPSQISRIVGLWREKLKQLNMERAAQALANPTDYENLFPGLVDTYKTEQFLRQENRPRAANTHPTVQANWERNPIEEMKEAENSGQFSYEPIRSNEDDDDENFDDANETPMKSTTESPMVKSSIPALASDQSRTQSPTNSSVSLKPTPVPSLTRESSIKSTTATVGSVRQSSLSDLEKELQEFDIDLDQDDDVSDAKNPSSASAKGARKKSTEENEVNTRIEHAHCHAPLHVC
jgi:hypothetical protein